MVFIYWDTCYSVPIHLYIHWISVEIQIRLWVEVKVDTKMYMAVLATWKEGILWSQEPLSSGRCPERHCKKLAPVCHRQDWGLATEEDLYELEYKTGMKFL